MKIITKEEEAAHSKQVLTGGAIGGIIGLGVGGVALAFANRRYASVRNLTVPFKAFLISSSCTFGLIVNAERYSIAFQKSHDPMHGYKTDAAREIEAALANRSISEKFMDWGRDNRYTIVFSSWLASMGLAFAIVNRSKALTAAQKIVQARVYAQGLTVAVLVVTAIFEMSDAKSGSGRWRTVLVADPNDPEHKKMIEKKIHKEEYEGQDLWKDMVAAEERRIAERKKQEAEAAGKPKAETL